MPDLIQSAKQLLATIEALAWCSKNKATIVFSEDGWVTVSTSGNLEKGVQPIHSRKRMFIDAVATAQVELDGDGMEFKGLDALVRTGYVDSITR